MKQPDSDSCDCGFDFTNYSPKCPQCHNHICEECSPLIKTNRGAYCLDCLLQNKIKIFIINPISNNSCKGCDKKIPKEFRINTNQGIYCNACLDGITLNHPPPTTNYQCSICKTKLYLQNGIEPARYGFYNFVYCESCYFNVIRELEEPIMKVTNKLAESYGM